MIAQDLLVLSPEDAGLRVELNGAPAAIGRAPDPERLDGLPRPTDSVALGDPIAVPLDSALVSRTHVVVVPAAVGCAYLYDLGSKNGTWAAFRRLEPHQWHVVDPRATRITLGGPLHGPQLLVVTRGETGPLELLDEATPTSHSLPPDPTATWSLIGRSPAMQQVAATARAAALAPRLGVLISGETGTGKELIARAVHAQSRRAHLPLVTVNCGGLADENVGLSELMGYERGAFTGAQARRAGVFERADGGAVFLDEVGELSGRLQSALLRVLQEGRVRRLGGAEESAVDVRVIAATNRELSAAVEAGTFRRDLYYRLAGLVIEVPPLRERGDDVRALARHLFREALIEDERPDLQVTEAALEALFSQRWPGNVRELRNAIRAAVALAHDSDRVHPHHVAMIGTPGATSAEPARDAEGGLGFQPIHDVIRRVRTAYVRDALAATGGNKTEAAKLLGTHARQLNRWLSEGD